MQINKFISKKNRSQPANPYCEVPLIAPELGAGFDIESAIGFITNGQEGQNDEL